MNRRPKIVAAFVVMGLLSVPSWAQDEEPEGAEETVEPVEETNADDASPDVFIPTEEISEDASVPFPVDI